MLAIRKTGEKPVTGVCLETIQKYYRVDRKEISYLRFIFEAYDGIALIRTVDPAAGIIAFHISPGCVRDAEMIIQDLRKEMIIEEQMDMSG